MLKVLRLFRPVQPLPQTGNQRPPIYFFARPLAWWKDLAAELTDNFSIESLRMLRKGEFEWLFGSSTQPAKWLRLLETAFPRLASRISPICVIDLGKPT